MSYFEPPQKVCNFFHAWWHHDGVPRASQSTREVTAKNDPKWCAQRRNKCFSYTALYWTATITHMTVRPPPSLCHPEELRDRWLFERADFTDEGACNNEINCALMHAWRFKLLRYMNQIVALAAGIRAPDSLAPSFFVFFEFSWDSSPVSGASCWRHLKHLQDSKRQLPDNSIVLGYLHY